MWRHLIAAALTAAALTLASAAVGQAQESGTGVERVPSRVYAYEPAYRIVYDHIRDTLRLVDNRGNVLERWHRFRPNAPVTLVGVPPDRPVEVVVENANPLLYRYSVRVELVQTLNAQTCRMIGRSFAQRAFLTAAGAVANMAAPKMDADKVLSTDLLTTIVSPSKGVSGGSKDAGVTFQLGEAEARAESQRLAASAQGILVEAGPRLRSYTNLLDTVAYYGTNSDSTLHNIAVRGETSPADSLLADLQSRLDRLQQGLSDPAMFAEILRQRSAEAAADLASLDEGVAMLSEAAELVRPHDASAADALLSGPTAQGFAVLKARVPLAARKAFSPTSNGSATARAQVMVLTVRQLRIDASNAQFTASPSANVQKLSLRLEPTQEWKEEIRTRLGEASVYVEPRTGRSCEISAGLAWLGAPELDVTEEGKVVAGDDDLRTPPAIFVTVARGPRSLLGATFGVGLGQYRRPDFFAGATWRWLSPVLITSGAALQRRPLSQGAAEDARVRYGMGFSWFGALTMSLNNSR